MIPVRFSLTPLVFFLSSDVCSAAAAAVWFYRRARGPIPTRIRQAQAAKAAGRVNTERGTAISSHRPAIRVTRLFYYG
jgi:hypothetical protein